MELVLNFLQEVKNLSGYQGAKSQSQIQSEASTWYRALSDIPDAWLMPAFQHAAAIHEWDRPFAVRNINAAYAALVLEDRRRIENKRVKDAYQNPDTYSCPYCWGEGYVPLELWCQSFNQYHRWVRGCTCDMAPFSQRAEYQLVDRRNWTKTEAGYWRPNEAFPCTCIWCRKGAK